MTRSRPGRRICRSQPTLGAGLVTTKHDKPAAEPGDSGHEQSQRKTFDLTTRPPVVNRHDRGEAATVEVKSRDPGASITVSFTQFEAHGDRLSKLYELGADGKVIKSGGTQLSNGRIRDRLDRGRRSASGIGRDRGQD